MSKVHEDNAGYVGVSYEETQDPFYSHNKLSLPLSESQLSAKQPAEETFTVTVSGGKFVIDGVSQASLTLVEGGIYKFDQSDSSNGTHPLRFSYTEDGTHGDGVEMTLGVTTNGTPGSAGAYTKIVVPFGLHDLYYYCSNHPGMGGFANVVKDTFKFTTGLPTFGTSDAFGKSTPVIDTSQYENTYTFTSESTYGTNTSIVYHASQAYSQSNASGYQSVTVFFNPAIQSVTNVKYVGGALAGGEYILKINGVQIGGTRTTSNSYAEESVNISSTNVTSIAVESVGTGNGWTLGSLKFNDTDRSGTTIGRGYPLANQDPYAANLVLAIPMNGANNGTAFEDVSNDIRGTGSALSVQAGGNAVTSTTASNHYGSSGYFPGGQNADCLTIGSGTSISSTDDFTIEYWYYQTGQPVTVGSVIRQSPGSDLGIIHWGGNYSFYPTTTNTGVATVNNQWTHVAFTRQSGTLRLYVNGVERWSYAGHGATILNSSNAFSIGSSGSGYSLSEYFQGYLSDFRIYKGVAKYTTPFTTGSYGMDVVTYTGNSSTQTISGFNFQPDLVYTSVTDATGYIKYIFDSVRGATKALATSHTQGDDVEATISSSLTSFNSNGFSLDYNSQVNENNRGMVAWGWKAGGAPTTDNVAGAGNVPTAGSAKVDGANMTTSLAGTIPATRLSASTKYGFSIVAYEGNGTGGSTVAHGITNATPKMVWFKNRDTDATNWRVYHTMIDGSLDFMYLNTNAAKSDSGLTTFTSTTFTVGTSNETNGNTDSMIAYVWSEVSGYSKFSSFSGNGSTQAITTGFKPAWIMFKRYDSNSAGADWYILDTNRFSGSQEYLLSPNNNSSQTGTVADYVVLNEDGFTLQTGNTLNGSGRSYIYAAFAESAPGDAAFESALVDQLDLKDRSSNSNNASNSGTSWQTSASKFYGGAADFSSSLVSVPNNEGFQIGSEDFSGECWVYADSVPTSSQGIFALWDYQNNRRSWTLQTFSGGEVRFYTSTDGTNTTNSNASTSLPANQWVHLAFTRQGSSMLLFKDGSLVSSATVNGSATTIYTNTQDDVLIGSLVGGASTYGFDGKIQDCRFYKGIAKYTSSFSPPERSVQGTARRYPSGIYVVS